MFLSDLSETSSQFSERFSEISENHSEAASKSRHPMSSVVTAQDLTLEIGELCVPGGNWKSQISAVYNGLTDEKFPLRLKGLRWNRVKAWFYGEARQAQYHEVLALQELRAIEEAKRAKLKLAATANLLAAHLAAAGAPLDSNQMRALGRLAGSLDLSGIAGAAE
ncbi:hypothetical protein MAUB1S_11423 [Mycolicibacterium aubagnense]